MRSRDKIFYYGMISLWENWALLTWNDERWLEACFGHFWSLRVTQGPLRVPNWQPIVTLEVKIKYLTMGWFHYGKTVCCLCERWKEECLMIWDMFWQFSGSEGPLQGSPMFPNWQPSVPWKVELKYLMGGFTIGKLGVACVKGGKRNIWGN